MMTTTKAVLAGLALSAAPAANAAVIGFEDTTVASGDALPNGYGGFNWAGMNVVDPVAEGLIGGWANGVTGRRIAYNDMAGTATISHADGFTLTSGAFVGAWRNGLQITATGFIGDAVAFSKVFTVNSNAALTVDFNWAGLSSVSFASAGGTDVFDVSGEQFGLDDLNISAVPEPTSWALMLTGVALMAGGLRRRRRLTIRFA